jgi:hypothetical protein
MKHLTIFILVSAFIIQSQGCGVFPSLDPNLDQKVDTWVAEHEYAKALKALANVPKSRSDYKHLQAKNLEVEKAAKIYEQQQLGLIELNIAKEEWHSAAEDFSQLKKQLPENETLQSAYQDFIKQRTSYLTNLNCQLSINQAQWLAKNAELEQKLAHAQPNDRQLQRALAQHKKDADSVYQQLSQCSINAINEGNLEFAVQCLQLADELQPSEALQSSISDLQQQLERQQQRTSKMISEHGKQLLEKAKSKMKEGNLKETVALYKRIPAKDKNYPAVISFKQELDKRVQTNVKQGIELGRKLYSQGEVKQALAIWNNILELDAQNQYLISYIRRAERVLEKLEKLQREGTTIKPPEPKDTNG